MEIKLDQVHSLLNLDSLLACKDRTGFLHNAEDTKVTSIGQGVVSVIIFGYITLIAFILFLKGVL